MLIITICEADITLKTGRTESPKPSLCRDISKSIQCPHKVDRWKCYDAGDPWWALSVIQSCILQFFFQTTSWIEAHNLHRRSSSMPHGWISNFRHSFDRAAEKKQIILSKKFNYKLKYVNRQERESSAGFCANKFRKTYDNSLQVDKTMGLDQALTGWEWYSMHIWIYKWTWKMP